MTKNLQAADTIVKLVLAITIYVFYFTNIITGPFANALMVLASITIFIFIARTVLHKRVRHK